VVDPTARAGGRAGARAERPVPRKRDGVTRLSVVTQRGSAFGFRLLHQLRRSGIEVAQVVVLSAATSRRLSTLRALARRMGWANASWYLVSGYLSSPYVLRERRWRGAELETRYGRLAQQVDRTRGPRSPDTAEALARAEPDLVLIGHCGILSPDVLAVPRFGTLNAHPGRLPDYRGADTEIWAIAEGRFDCVGLTVHVAEPRVDAGPILERRPYVWRGDETLDLLRDRLMDAAVDALVEWSRKPWPGALAGAEAQGEGRLYYAIPPRERRRAARRLAAHLADLPSAGPS